MTLPEEKALIGRSTITELVREYELAVADIRRAYAIVHDAEQRLNKAFSGAPNSRSIHVHEGHSWMSWDEPDRSLKQVRIDCWRALVDRLELRRFLSIKAYQELKKNVQEDKMPELTLTTVTDLSRSFADQLPDLLADAVREVFEWLRPWHWDPSGARHKSVDTWKVGKRVIREYVVHKKWSGSPGFEVRYDREIKLTALENVFSALDGQGQVSKGHHSKLSQAIKDSPDGKGETKYFSFRCFKNGNLHLTFKRPDLVQQLNKVAGGKSLRGKTAKP